MGIVKSNSVRLQCLCEQLSCDSRVTWVRQLYGQALKETLNNYETALVYMRRTTRYQDGLYLTRTVK